MAIYLKLGKIEGSVTKVGYEGWIPLDNAAFAAHRNISQIVGEVANRSRSVPQMTTITCGKKTDQASEGLMRAAVSKTKGEDAELHYVTPVDDNKVEANQKIKLTDAIVAAYNQSASTDGDAYESLEISFSKIDTEFVPADKAGTGGDPKHVIYDLSTGEAS